MHPEWPGEAHAYGICGGVSAEECEAEQFEGRLLKGNRSCVCDDYRSCVDGKRPYGARGRTDDGDILSEP